MQTQATERALTQVEMRAVSALQPHPRNAQLYGAPDLDLIESIRVRGVEDPLIVTWDNRIISGHRRWSAAREAMLDTVPVIVHPTRDEVDVLDLLVTYNQHRAKTNEQIGREYNLLVEVESERAARRVGGRPGAGKPPENLPEVSGDARDIAARRFGLSGKSGAAAGAVVEVIDYFAQSGKSADADRVRTLLNEVSINKAYQHCEAVGHFKALATAKESRRTPKSVITLQEWAGLVEDDRAQALARRSEQFKFNAQDSTHIEWAQWSWNPVTGCKHDCSYCYARDIAERFYAHRFVPAVIPERLSAPANTAIPPRAAHDVAYKNVFTCSMADLFGKWVPREWIEAVLAEVWAHPQWNFLFLTKFPIRLAEFDFPQNAWLGTTIDAQARIPNAEKAFARLRGGIKWLSCEPMLERLTFTRLDLFDWVVVGGASPSSQTPGFRPPREWVEHLERQARDAGCRVYEKTNLLVRHTEYPGQPDEGWVSVPDEGHWTRMRVTPSVPDAFKMRYLQRDVHEEAAV